MSYWEFTDDGVRTRRGFPRPWRRIPIVLWFRWWSWVAERLIGSRGAIHAFQHHGRLRKQLTLWAIQLAGVR